MENLARQLDRSLEKRAPRFILGCADLHIVGTLFAFLLVSVVTGAYPDFLDAPFIAFSLALFGVRFTTKVLAWAVCTVRIEGGEDRIRAHVVSGDADAST
jgi:hypothetical protein